MAGSVLPAIGCGMAENSLQAQHCLILGKLVFEEYKQLSVMPRTEGNIRKLHFIRACADDYGRNDNETITHCCNRLFSDLHGNRSQCRPEFLWAKWAHSDSR